MSYIYSDTERETEEHALPNIQVFYMDDDQALEMAEFGTAYGMDAEAGWYWWSCFPGCMPDGDPMGPFETENEAIADAQNIG